MNIKETYAGFTEKICPGRFGFFIILDTTGVSLNVDEVCKQAIHFPRVIIMGDEPFNQKEDIAKLIKKTTKENPEIIFEIHCSGTIKPTGVAMFSNIFYYVNVQLKNSGISYEKRIKGSALTWFNNSSGDFIFNIESKDDLDEVEMLVNEFTLKKAKMVIVPKPGIENYVSVLREVMKFCKIKGYSYNFDYRMIIGVLNNEKRRAS